MVFELQLSNFASQNLKQWAKFIGDVKQCIFADTNGMYLLTSAVTLAPYLQYWKLVHWDILSFLLHTTEKILSKLFLDLDLTKATYLSIIFCSVFCSWSVLIFCCTFLRKSSVASVLMALEPSKQYFPMERKLPNFTTWLLHCCCSLVKMLFPSLKLHCFPILWQKGSKRFTSKLLSVDYRNQQRR